MFDMENGIKDYDEFLDAFFHPFPQHFINSYMFERKFLTRKKTEKSSR